MQQIGTVAKNSLQQVALPNSDARLQQSALTIRRQTNLLAYNQPQTDLEIPRDLWSSWKEEGKPRMIRRLLTDEERSLVAGRRDELAPWLMSFHPAERREIDLALTEMFSGFSSGRDVLDTAARIETLLRKLADYPAWAIQRAADRIGTRGYQRQDGERVVTERHWPPSDPELVLVIDDELKLYQGAYNAAIALLAAPVEAPQLIELKPTLAELKEKYGPNFGMEAAAAALLEAQAPERRKVIAAYTPEDLERLASHLKKQDAA